MKKGKHSQNKTHIKNKKPKEKRSGERKSIMMKFLKFLGILILILIVILLGIGVGGYLYLKNTIGQVQQVNINEEAIEVNEGVEQELTGYRTIALFGVDSRESQIEKGTRSDCIMLAIIDQKNKNVKLVSVYRDSYLLISGRSLDKVTHAYAYGGPELSLSTLNTNLDLNIKEFATVNFDSLVDIVDAVGGITMQITNAEITTGKINSYIDETAKVVGKKANHITKAGTYNLDGVQATAYSRLRYTSGGDYKRTERMRDVLMAIVSKAKKMNIGQLKNLANKVLPEIYTNINPNEIISLLPQVATYSISESMGWPYEVKGATIGGVWYGVPNTLKESVEKLHREVYEQQDYEISNKVKAINESIIKKTGSN